MLKSKIEDLLNEQVNKELFSAYLYLSMAAYFESKNLQGFANWMRVQAQEELTHAMKFFDYINERGGRVILSEIDKPENEWEDVVEVFEETLAHEKKVTESINNILQEAIEEKDFATQNFLQWFVNEQVEEEATASLLLERLKMIGDNKAAMFFMDKELQSRTFNPTEE